MFLITAITQPCFCDEMILLAQGFPAEHQGKGARCSGFNQVCQGKNSFSIIIDKLTIFPNDFTANSSCLVTASAIGYFLDHNILCCLAAYVCIEKGKLHSSANKIILSFNTMQIYILIIESYYICFFKATDSVNPSLYQLLLIGILTKMLAYYQHPRIKRNNV